MSTSNDTYPNQTNSTQETKNKERVCIGIDIGTEIPQCYCLCYFHTICVFSNPHTSLQYWRIARYISFYFYLFLQRKHDTSRDNH